ncbi:hypothetical protein [Flavobacterium cerinum]|uniref:Uncharacterized protein n=1 Tax=Flavobacterium cerinum TaxID=2502784 RepID=A0A3S3QLJ6_9FLAO|nr:hypothetical protein [Flavobacterium cerinum]RWX00943.1 hypothetical protein EPI11_07935 [Flavobacterium cerinum]
MKIELELTTPQFVYLSAAFHSYCEFNKPKFHTLSGQQKAIYTISQAVADKLYTRTRGLSRQPSPSKTKKGKPKLHKLTLIYHEARAVSVYMCEAKDIEPDEFFRALANNIYSQLDQKL